MTDTPKGRAVTTMPTGGAVMAIVPQTFEELQRIANTIIAGGLAPTSLLAKVKTDAPEAEIAAAGRHNVAAVATVLMAGAELGLPPMAALRSFTVINGKPALYADGNLAVVRKARDSDGNRVAKRIASGFTVILDSDGKRSDESYAWCEAERADTGEVHREEFSIADAKDAILWDDRPETEREVWAYDDKAKKRLPKKQMLPNDAPWHRYWKRMLLWRATGYCLRWLFADVLNGMVDEYEARDMSMMVDITPTPTIPTSPPEPPPEPEAPAAGTTPAAEGAEPPHGEADGPGDSAAPPVEADTIEDMLAELEELLSHADDADEVDGAFDSFDVQGKFAGDEDALSRAFAIKRAALGEPAHDPVTGEIADLPPEPPDEDTTPRAEGVNDMFEPGK